MDAVRNDSGDLSSPPLRYRTEETYLKWIQRFIRFNDMRHPREMGAPENTQYLRYHLIEMGYDNRTVKELLGHAEVKTTMVYTHVLKRGGNEVRSPADNLLVNKVPGSRYEEYLTGRS